MIDNKSLEAFLLISDVIIPLP